MVTLTVGIGGALIAAVVTWLSARRSTSGSIETSRAEDLWESLRANVTASQDEAQALRVEAAAGRAEMARLRDESVLLRSEASAGRTEMAHMRDESALLRAESEHLREEIVTVRAETVLLRKALASCRTELQKLTQSVQKGTAR